MGAIKFLLFPVPTNSSEWLTALESSKILFQDGCRLGAIQVGPINVVYGFLDHFLVDPIDELLRTIERQPSDDLTELQVESQKMSFMMSATNEVIKNMGEALSAVARQQ